MKKEKRKEAFSFLYEKFGFRPDNTEYYNEAFTHRSLHLSDEHKGVVNNERLEFLGDAVLNMVFAEYLYRKFPEKKEGEMSMLRARLAKRETLNHIAVEMGLDKLLRVPQKHMVQKDDIYGNALEAFCGAVFLDKGFDFCSHFVQTEMLKHVDLNKLLVVDTDYKSQLLARISRRKLKMEFVLVYQKKIEGNKDFFCTKILVEGDEIAIGTGYSKKESQQDAAKMALKKIK
ncbi:MAG: ribonuclease III [Paludibacteraceae bacterium]|nr:ribonuclease III [Paludibacteraceae bacterium]